VADRWQAAQESHDRVGVLRRQRGEGMIGASTRPSGRTPVCRAARIWASVQRPSPGSSKPTSEPAEIARHVRLAEEVARRVAIVAARDGRQVFAARDDGRIGRDGGAERQYCKGHCHGLQRLRYEGAMHTILIYVTAALAEIAGCFAFWAWLRLGASAWWLAPGLGALALFAWLLTLVDLEAAGRTYAAYGGIYIAATLVWLWLAEGIRPDRWDLVGALVCVAGAAIILFAPHRAVS